MILNDKLLKQACDNAAMFLSDSVDENDLLYFELTPEYIKFTEKIKKEVINKKNNTFSLTVKIIIIAAIIIALAVSGIAIFGSKDFFIENFNTYSSYIVNKKDGKILENLTVGYIPDGFYETCRNETDVTINLEFENDTGSFINTQKRSQVEIVNIDTETEPTSLISKNNIDYTFYGSKECYGIIWTTENYVYTLNGNISKDELLKIAESIK